MSTCGFRFSFVRGDGNQGGEIYKDGDGGGDGGGDGNGDVDGKRIKTGREQKTRTQVYIGCDGGGGIMIN